MKAIGLILILITGAMACESSQTNLSNKGFDVQLIEYTKPGKHYSEAVLIIPPIYGTNFIDKSYAKALCRQGIKAIIVHRWSKDREQTVELDMYKRFYKRAQKAIKLTIDANKKYKLGILGTSSGGIHAAIATSRFDEIKTSLLIVSGGNIAAILAESSQKIVSKQRNTRRVKLGLNSSKEYKDALKKHLPF
jgi:poly(3-hydroxyalkanoate) synthetase